MTFTSLTGRLDTLPLVLCGPILRRVLPTSVTVWVALRKPATVNLSVYESDGPQRVRVMPPVPFAAASRATTPVGEHLHITAVTARGPSSPLQEGKVYFYDLTFDSAGTTQTLEQATATQPSQVDRFSYAPLTKLPSFSLPPSDLNNLRLIHGSCRKANGDSDDLLAALDDLIGATANIANARPHQLLMTGDQIYADEVADILLLLATDAADALLGPTRNEVLPGARATAGPFFAHNFPPGTRVGLTEDAGFTTDDRRSHLMAFGEYMAMYLLAWSDVLWPVELPTVDDVIAHGAGRLKAPVLIDVLQDSADQISAVNRFKATVGKVRRALANIPSYMICDDHEITDDWNMTREWCENVYGNPLGLRIVQNGLVAFALCQAWGNTPEQFEDDPFNPAGKKLLDLFQSGGAYPSDASAMQAIVGVHDANTLTNHETVSGTYGVFHDTGANGFVQGMPVYAASLRFDFTVEGPAHQVIVTDTRTWRTFPVAGKVEHGDLLGAAEVSTQIQRFPALGDRLQLVVVTTNMPPIPAIRFAERLLSIKDSEVYGNDLYDSWRFPSAAMDRFFTQLSERMPKDASTPAVRSGRVVLLSGDVHHSCASRITYRADARFGDPPGQRQAARLVCAQLVASAFKNMNDKTRGLHDRGYTYAPHHLGFLLPKLQPEGALGWAVDANSSTDVQIGVATDLVLVNVTTGAGTTTITQAVDVPSFVNGRKPSLSFLPDLEDVTQTALSHLLGVFKLKTKITRPADYRYQIDQIIASASGQVPPKPPTIPGVPSGSDAASRQAALNAYSSAAAAYRNYQSTAGRGRAIVGVSSLSEITFTWGQGEAKQVHHTVRWRDPDKPSKQDILWARFDVSLALDDPKVMLKYSGEP